LPQARELAEADEVDPLDAFMAAEILPEVKQKEQEEAAKKEEERRQLAKQLAVCLPGSYSIRKLFVPCKTRILLE
jgi:hypothetical protein